jgi:hypothetical protein
MKKTTMAVFDLVLALQLGYKLRSSEGIQRKSESLLLAMLRDIK